MKGGRRSISTFSVTTKRLLRCFLGGLPTMGIVSLGPARRRLRVVARGGVAFPRSRPRECLSEAEPGRGADSEAESEETTTIGGAGESAGDLRSGVDCGGDAGERDLVDVAYAVEGGADWGTGFDEFGGGGGGADAAAYLESFLLDAESCELFRSYTTSYKGSGEFEK